MNTYDVTYKYLDEETGEWESGRTPVVASSITNAVEFVTKVLGTCIIKSVSLNDPNKKSETSVADLFLSLFANDDQPELHIGEVDLDKLLGLMDVLESALHSAGSINHSDMMYARIFSDRSGTVEMGDKELFDFKLK